MFFSQNKPVKIYEISRRKSFSEEELYYFVVVDAGSSGSRLRLYSGKKTSDNLLSDLKEEFSNEVTPGLQDVAEADLPAYLTRLFTGLNETLETLGIDTTEQNVLPVRFYATAGMREVNPVTQNQTYTLVTDWIENNPEFAFSDIIAKTIPGEQEALYNWLAVNYLNGAFANKEQPAGVFDLGGGSSEIAYLTPDLTGTTVFSITLSNETYHVASETWLGTGQDWARAQYLDHQGCFPIDYPMPDLRAYSGDLETCQLVVNDPFVTDENLHPMGLSSNFYKQDIHLIASFYYLNDALVYQHTETPASTEFDIVAFRESAKAYCNTPWDVINQDPVYSEDPYTNTYCFGASLTDSMYENMWLDDLTEDFNLWVTKKIEGTSVSWSVGVVNQLITGAEFIQLPQPPTPAPIDNSSNATELSSGMLIGIYTGAGVVGALGLMLVGAKYSKQILGAVNCCTSRLWKTTENKSGVDINSEIRNSLI